MYGQGYGMPSSHAQFVTFFSLYLSFFLLFRHKPAPSRTHTPTSLLERQALSMVACVCAGLVATSRIYLNYHTPKQVLVGCTAGAVIAVAWFLVTTILRRYGWIDWALDISLARSLRMRDLAVTEDLADAGWGRWESRRKAGRSKENGTLRKHR
jgi:dolichyldiphosphatase